MSLTWTPPFSGFALWIMAILILVGLGLMAWRVRPPVTPSLIGRLAALVCAIAALFDPRVMVETKQALPDIALIVADDSASQSIADRASQAAEAQKVLEARLGKLTDIDTRIVHAGAGQPLSQGTRLFDAINQALSDVPADRLGAIFLLTDGVVHDVPADLGKHWGVPIHVLLTGHPHQSDRRIDIIDQPDFALVGQSAHIRFRVVADGEPPGPYPVTIEVDGVPMIQDSMPTDREMGVDIPIRHAGQTIVDIAVAAGPHEVSLTNNHRVLGLSGVRDRLKVLLLSGSPHVGERVWRSLLKSDPAVDLIHFTILRSPDKEDPTPLSELSLINFPVRELFEDKLPDFDLVVLDRYRGANLPQAYLDRLADYVKGGGALLLAAGPEFGDPQSNLSETQLGALLPQSLGPAQSTPFRPMLSAIGRRHPVTSVLADQEDHWGRWLRLDPAKVTNGSVVLQTPDGQPVMVLDHVGEGRLGVFLSDSAWLWARGWEGGGPYRILLRRLAHWLMKEPDLEEERLWARLDNNRLTVNRQSLDPIPPPVVVTSPQETTTTLSLTDHGNGLQTADMPATTSGLWRVSDGKNQAVAIDGDPSPLEMNEIVATARHLQPVAQATQGWLGWIAEDGIPELRRTTMLDRPKGANWAGIVRRDTAVVTGLEQSSNWPSLCLLAICAVFLGFSWIYESK